MRLKHDRMSLMLRGNAPVAVQHRSPLGIGLQGVGVLLMLLYCVLQLSQNSVELLKRQALYTAVSMAASASYLWNRQMASSYPP